MLEGEVLVGEVWDRRGPRGNSAAAVAVVVAVVAVAAAVREVVAFWLPWAEPLYLSAPVA